MSKGTSGVLWPWEKNARDMDSSSCSNGWRNAGPMARQGLHTGGQYDWRWHRECHDFSWFSPLLTLMLSLVCYWTAEIWMWILPWVIRKMSLKALVLGAKAKQCLGNASKQAKTYNCHARPETHHFSRKQCRSHCHPCAYHWAGWDEKPPYWLWALGWGWGRVWWYCVP